MLDQVQDFLNTPLITLSDHTVTAGQVLAVPALLLVGFFTLRWLGRVIRARLMARNVNADAVQLVSRAFYIVGIAVLFITTLELINVPLTAFAFVSGAVAIGVGFGAQNIINNFISGWILMWERPIRIGDVLEVSGTRGTVEQINTRSTRIRRIDGVHMLLPNSFLLENVVVNWTLVDELARSTVRVGVAYGSETRRVAQLIQEATESQPQVIDDPSPVVIFDDFGDNALMFEVYFWIHARGDTDLRVVRSNIRFAIEDLFAQHDIVIAFPQRDVHVDGELRISQTGPGGNV
ncbi:MAG: mechanosensitive ion channel domain-containing protein [Pseudomonadota bacterium]